MFLISMLLTKADAYAFIYLSSVKTITSIVIIIILLIVALVMKKKNVKSVEFRINKNGDSNKDQSSTEKTIEPGAWTCPTCKRVNRSYATTCECGAVKDDKLFLSATSWKCAFCNRENPNNFNFCYCGHRKEETLAANKASNQEKAKQNESDETKEICFLVRNYYPSLPIKILSLSIVSTRNEIQISKIDCYLYESEITAVRIKVLLTDLWNEEKTFPDIDLQIPSGSQGRVVLPLALRISNVNLSSILSVHVVIDKVLINSKIVENNMQPIEILQKDNEIAQLRARLGDEAVTEIEITSTFWRCSCGNVNPVDNNMCPLCQRTMMNPVRSDLLDTDKMLQDCKKMQSLKEIHDYLATYKEKTKNEAFQEMLGEMKYNIEVERLYGNMKKTAIERLQTFHDAQITH